MFPTTTTIAIIGAGYVGSAIANALLLRQVARDIILVDIDEDLCRAQVQDLSDAAFLSATRVTQGSYRDASLCDIIVIAAGIGPRFDESRLGLIDKNLEMLKQVLGAMRPLREDAIVVIVANPVDLLTYFAQQLSGLPRCQVFGSGTSLDSVRLRTALAERLQVSLYVAVHTW
jgi:L-lactate dehydrogenase